MLAFIIAISAILIFLFFFAWHSMRQLDEKAENIYQIEHISPGSVQRSSPEKELLEEDFLPGSFSHMSEKEIQELLSKPLTKPLPKVKKRFPFTQKDLLRSYIIDELLDKKTK